MEEDKMMDDKKMDGKDGWMEDKEPNVLMANITFLSVALGAAVGSALELFRYRSESTYYDGGKILSSNYWKLADVIALYGALVLGSVAATTQLLSMLGIATEINVMVWMLGFPLVGGLVGLFYSIMMFLAYDGSYSIAADTKKTAAERAAGAALQLVVEKDALYNTAMETAVMLSLFKEGEAWWYGQWMAMEAAKKDGEMEGKMEGDMDGEKGPEGPEGPDGEKSDAEAVMEAYAKFFAF